MRCYYCGQERSEMNRACESCGAPMYKEPDAIFEVLGAEKKEELIAVPKPLLLISSGFVSSVLCVVLVAILLLVYTVTLTVYETTTDNFHTGLWNPIFWTIDENHNTYSSVDGNFVMMRSDKGTIQFWNNWLPCWDADCGSINFLTDFIMATIANNILISLAICLVILSLTIKMYRLSPKTVAI